MKKTTRNILIVTSSFASLFALTAGLLTNQRSITKEVKADGVTTDLSTLTGNHVAQDGETLTGTLGGIYKISVADGATVTLNNAIIEGVNDSDYPWSGLTCEGDATINLVGENTLKGFDSDYGGISFPADKTLTIYGPGSLLAGSSSDNGWGAGIGSPNGETCGNIIINGATIEASSRLGSGIGGGESGSCGDITITGSTINTHAENGSGIGPGQNASSGGNITITNSEINASASSYCAVIGSSEKNSIGNITLTNSNITIIGEGYDTPIGAAYKSTCGDITINGGTLNITAIDNSAAIGSGYCGTCGDITILDGNITATGGEYSPAIGAGAGDSSSGAACGNITISGGTINAYGGKYASAIGAGQGVGTTCKDILISGGTVTATAKSNSSCPGIGTSTYESHVGNVTVTNTVNLLTVTRGDDCVQTIGTSNWASSNTCGTVTIGGKAYYPTNNPFVFPVSHEHSWSYVADGASITATCGNEDCPVTSGLTLSLVAPTNLVFDGSAKTASFEAGYSSEAFGTPTIEYFQNESSVASCVNAGAYEARVTVGGATAKVQFEIAQATPTGYDIPTGLEAVYGDKLSSVTLPEHWSWKNPDDLVGNVGNRTHIAIYTPEDPNYHSVEENVTIAVAKANPAYVVPSTIDAPYDVELSTIGLPEGFSWMEGTQKTSTWGESTFKAKYTPSDTVNYNVVENIDIKVNVKWILVDPTEGDVSVTIKDGETAYNVDISVKVEVKTEVTVDEKRTEYASIGREFIKQDEDINAIYSVKLIRTVGGVQTEIQPSDIKDGTKIIVSMPVPEELVSKPFRLLEIFSTTEAKEMENYALSKDGKTLVVEVDRMGEFAFVSHTDVPNGFDYSTVIPGWAIVLIIVGSILLLCLLCFFLLFFVFNKWIRKDDKALRAVKFGKKDNKVRLLVMPFRFEYRQEAEVFDTKQEALKE